jgi:hypothetical protein
MQVVCEATQNPSVSVQVGAFECLVKIMALYYDKMAFYMEQALFGVRPLVYPAPSPPDRTHFPAYCYGHEAF